MQEERRRILDMLQAGTISAEEAATLMDALGDKEPVAAIAPVIAEPPVSAPTEEPADEEIIIVEKPSRPIAEFSPPWALPFGLGLGLLMLGVGILWVMSYLGQMSFLWFFCGLIPLGWAVVFILVAAWLAWGLWLHVRVDSEEGSRVRVHIPLPPFGLAVWGLRLAGRFVPRFRESALDEVLEAMHGEWKRGEPLIVHVDDDGDQVEVIIG